MNILSEKKAAWYPLFGIVTIKRTRISQKAFNLQGSNSVLGYIWVYFIFNDWNGNF